MQVNEDLHHWKPTGGISDKLKSAREEKGSLRPATERVCPVTSVRPQAQSRRHAGDARRKSSASSRQTVRENVECVDTEAAERGEKGYANAVYLYCEVRKQKDTTRAFTAWERKRQLYKRYSVTRFHFSNVDWQRPKEL
ncbi:unnamed protein product [Leuciscus chuanchicus]